MPEPMIQILQPDGSLAEGAEVPDISAEQLIKVYQTMMLNRLVDEQMIRLQRQGRIGFYIGSIGEEASIVASAAAIEPDDWIVPCYRELGAALYRGYPIYDFFCQLFGNSQDAVMGRQMPNHYALPQLRFTSISSPVGTQIPQGVGMAWAAKISGGKEVALVFFGDGATSQGDFHVAANFAGVYQIPVLLFCRNNQWAISVPLETQTASESIAIKAKAYGIEGVRVDGNDTLAVWSVTRRAAEKAREEGVPTLIEAVTYRVSGHSTSDDPRAYRQEDSVKPWLQKDPLPRLKQFLIAQDHWSQKEDERLRQRLKAEIQDNIKRAEKEDPPTLQTMFEDVYDEMPWHLREQLEELEEARSQEVVEQEV